MCTRFTSTVMAARYRLAAMVTAALVLVLVMGPALAARPDRHQFAVVLLAR